MVYFLYGPDTYSSRKKVAEIIGEFNKKVGGGLNVTRIDAYDRPDAVFAIGRNASLFQTKELAIIENASLASREVQTFIRDQLGGWKADRDMSVVFWEADIGDEDAFGKSIRKHATKSQEFKPLSPAALMRWFDEAARKRNVRLSEREKENILLSCGPDLWALGHELDKIEMGWSVKSERQEAEKIWGFTDAFFRNPRNAFLPLMKLLEAGYETIYLLGALVSSLHTAVAVWWGFTQGRLKKAGSGLHPYAVKKNVELAKRLGPDSVRRLYRRLVTADVEQKTSRLPQSLSLLRLVLDKRQTKTSA